MMTERSAQTTRDQDEKRRWREQYKADHPALAAHGDAVLNTIFDTLYACHKADDGEFLNRLVKDMKAEDRKIKILHKGDPPPRVPTHRTPGEQIGICVDNTFVWPEPQKALAEDEEPPPADNSSFVPLKDLKDAVSALA